jgi:class 3 adenylate cyclase
MIRPQVQYVRASDGVDIAFWTLGNGPALVYMPDPTTSHAELVWQMPHAREWLEALSARRTVVWYDCRGSGLSEREVSDFSLEAMTRDLDAVVSRLGLERFSLFTLAPLGPVAMRYAREHPEAVSHLLLFMCTPRGADITRAPQARALGQLSAADWTLYTETLARFAVGWALEEPARELARLMRECIAPDTIAPMYEAISRYDATDVLSDIRVPALVLHRREFRWHSVDSARRLAASIPDARLVLLEGSAAAPWLENMEAVVHAIDAFAPAAAPRPADPPPSGTTIIVFADIADSTALTERMGDAAFREKARALDDALRAIVRDNGGAAIDGKLLGDGILATFPAASQAIAAALAFEGAATDVGLGLHVGVHAGDVIREDNNVFGGAVNIAARISALAEPGEVLVSDIVRGLARTSAGVAFEDRGEHALKGVAEPQRVFAVRRA